MVVHRVDGADVDGTAERQTDDKRAPADSPGTDDALSRADSRIGAQAANDKPVPAGAEVPQPYAKQLDIPIADDQPTPREVLDRFTPAEAGLPEVTNEQAAEYIAQTADDRPWLAAAKDCDPAVQRILAAMDQGQGHALERHEGFADDDKLRRRVTALEDPAQLDADKRMAAIDGCKPGDKNHRCGDTATAIQDPAAFATMFARGVEHAKVQEALRMPYDPDRLPQPVSIPVRDLLGADGHRYCSGYTLEPVDGSLSKARDHRAAWVEARRTPGREPGVSDPRCTAVDGFEAAQTQYFFRSTREKDGYEIATMYVELLRGEEQE
ncbi:MAG: hypothetical protein JWP48_4154 [Actinoallomurus sp.]|jgi:hypothetical protein|nr:hypothetical protein [Actinoallomurus sp.]